MDDCVTWRYLSVPENLLLSCIHYPHTIKQKVNFFPFEVMFWRSLGSCSFGDRNLTWFKKRSSTYNLLYLKYSCKWCKQLFPQNIAQLSEILTLYMSSTLCLCGSLLAFWFMVLKCLFHVPSLRSFLSRSSFFCLKPPKGLLVNSMTSNELGYHINKS